MKTELRKRWDKGEVGILNSGIYMTAGKRSDAFEKDALLYCSQNNQDCNTCSLVNYGRDCHNNKID
ncbi:MAG: hypothetical protein FVQ79_08290 [Planctomycetes bacterium]|nr:hypothetical protein [Planctomycetota bacterium]